MLHVEQKIMKIIDIMDGAPVAPAALNALFGDKEGRTAVWHLVECGELEFDNNWHLVKVKK